MKKTIKLLSMATLMIALGTSSCKKYNDGGNTRKFSKKIQDKTWHLSYYKGDSDFSEWKEIYFSSNNYFVINNEVWGTYEDINKTSILLDIDDKYKNEIINLFEGDTNTFNTSPGVGLVINKLTKTSLGLEYSHNQTILNYETY